MAPSTLLKMLLLPLAICLVNAACPAALTAAPAQPEVVGALGEAVCPEGKFFQPFHLPCKVI
jgi:hypothetical protein